MLLIKIVKKGECQHDSDCADDKACIENQCLDPCYITEPCGKNAICKTSSHRPVCRCPSDWAGNPHQECYQCRLLFEHSNVIYLFLELKVLSKKLGN